jgi:hypothetical protein
MDAPLTPQEMQEKLRSGELKIVSAPQEYVFQYSKELHELLMFIGALMSDDDDDPKDWAESCFVTDMSSLGDFFSLCDEDTPGNLQALSEELGFPVERSMYLHEIAARMHGVQ